jgi:hypothetical protein
VQDEARIAVAEDRLDDAAHRAVLDHADRREAGRAHAGDARGFRGPYTLELEVAHDVPIDDLHTLTSAFPPELFKSKGNVHFSDEGYRKIGAQVAAEIEKALKAGP